MSKNINIQMKQFNGVDYDNIYPSVPSNIVKSSEFLNGIIPSNNIDEAFESLNSDIYLISSNLAKVKLTVKSNSGRLIPNIKVDGMTSINGQQVTTNLNGIAIGYVKEGTVTLNLAYADIESSPIKFNAIRGQKYEKEFIVNMRNFISYTGSTDIWFTDNVDSIDVTVVGAGGGGGGSSYVEKQSSNPGAGGGGGQCIVSNNVKFAPFVKYTVIIAGSPKGGNNGSQNGSDGGASSFLGISANGGKGGQGGNNGGLGGKGNGGGGASNGYPGNGKTRGYSSYTTTKLYGGGGGGGNASGTGVFLGGDDCGGRGGGVGYNGADGNPSSSSPCGGGGGGGAGAATSSVTTTKGGSGGKGLVAIRMHLKSTT